MKINRTRSPGVTGIHHRFMRTADAAIGLCHRLFSDLAIQKIWKINSGSRWKHSIPNVESRIKQSEPDRKLSRSGQYTTNFSTGFVRREREKKIPHARFELLSPNQPFQPIYRTHFSILFNRLFNLFPIFRHFFSPGKRKKKKKKEKKTRNAYYFFLFSSFFQRRIKGANPLEGNIPIERTPPEKFVVAARQWGVRTVYK